MPPILFLIFILAVLGGCSSPEPDWHRITKGAGDVLKDRR